MELRYVYRGLEDAIGEPFRASDSPHARIARRLRFRLRELKDARHRSDIRAICLSSLAGNMSIDVEKTIDDVNEALSAAYNDQFPYWQKQVVKKQTQSDRYAEYFKILSEMKKEKEAKEAANKETGGDRK